MCSITELKLPPAKRLVQAERFGTEFATGEVKAAELKERPFRLTLADGELTTDTLIVGNFFGVNNPISSSKLLVNQTQSIWLLS